MQMTPTIFSVIELIKMITSLFLYYFSVRFALWGLLFLPLSVQN